MARAQKKAQGDGSNKKKLNAGALKALWKKIPIQEWRRLLQGINHEGQWTVNGNTIKGCCPYHDDHTPSFVLNFYKCIGKCFGSCGKVVTDLVSLFAKISQRSYAEALVELASQFDLGDIIGPGVDELAEFNASQEMKKAVAQAMRLVIDEYLREKPKHLEYLRPALSYLVKGRGIPLNLLGTGPMLPIGIFAKPEHLKKHIPAEYHELFSKYFAKINTRAWWGSICFHYNIQPGCISRFKLRKLAPDAAEVCSKYKRLAEMPEDIARSLTTKDFIVVDDPFIPEMGVFGLHFYNRMIGASEANAYLTEGEFDALSVMVA